MFRRIADGFDEFKGIPREANLLIFASLFNWAAAGLLFITLQVFLVLEGLDFATSGLVLTVFGVTSAPSTLFFGALANRYGRRRFVVIGGLVSALSLALFGLVGTNIPLLFSAAILSGLSEAMFAASWTAILADKAGDAKRTSAFSLSFFVSTISSAVGGFSASLLGPLDSMLRISLVEGHRYLFVSVAVVSLLGPALALRVSESKISPNGSIRFEFKPRMSSWKATYQSWKTVLKYSFTGALIAFGAGMVIPLVPGWAYLKFGVKDDVSAPIFGGINSLVMGLANLATPRLARTFGTVKTIVLTQASSTIFLFSMPFTPNFPVASAVFITRSCLMMMSNPTEQSLLMGLVSDDRRSMASSISAALWRFPNSFSTGIGAYIMGLGGFLYLGLPFWICTVFYLTSISLFWYFFREVRLPEEKTLIEVPVAT